MWNDFRIGKGKEIPHEMMICLFQASIEIACMNDASLKFFSWQDILESEMFPAETGRLAKPFQIPVTITGNALVNEVIERDGRRVKVKVQKEETRDRHIEPDGRPFVIQYTSPKGTNISYCFPGCEIDYCTEPNEPADIYVRANIEHKLKGYLDIIRKRTCKAHFGFPNVFVPFITSGAVRKRNFKQLLKKISDGNGASNIIFSTFSNPITSDRTLDPKDFTLDREWDRVGADARTGEVYGPFNIIEEMKAEALRKENAS